MDLSQVFSVYSISVPYELEWISSAAVKTAFSIAKVAPIHGN